MPAIYLSPGRRLYVEGDDLWLYKELAAAFSKGSGHGLLYLDGAGGSYTEDPAFAFWKDFARRYLSLFSATPDMDTPGAFDRHALVELPDEDLGQFFRMVPPMKGAEYVDEECLLDLWDEIGTALRAEITDFGKGPAEFMAARHSDWHLVGRVCFHLAENKDSPERPFAFLATYVQSGSREGKSRHLPLESALKEYSGAKNKRMLLRLLSPVHRASLESRYLKEMIDSEDIYHPVAWTAGETYRFLEDIPIFEKAGIAVKVPNWWKAKRPIRPQVSVRIGDKRPGSMGLDALVDFEMSVVIGDEALTGEDIQELLRQSERLIFFKGEWVEVDREKLSEILSTWKTVARSVKTGGITFAEGLRWLSGLGEGPGRDDAGDARRYTRVIPGKWLGETLHAIRAPEADQASSAVLKANLKTALRPYQAKGVAWLNALSNLRLGAILADDMGLGKTIQVLALFLLKGMGQEYGKKPALLIVPASLVGNWISEIDKFAPSIRYWVAHPSGDGLVKPPKSGFDVVITTYGSVARMEWVAEECWDIIVADEAQAIKNPSAKQTKAVKKLTSAMRIVLTGTPIENHLSDLWSLFDFVSPGLLGSMKEFYGFMKSRTDGGDSPYAGLRELVRPYILRRLKTDKSVINDLPEKTEMKVYCSLTKGQAALYQRSVESLKKDIQGIAGIKRRGVVLSYLMRFKQICNHPSQFVKDGKYSATDSGKFTRLKEISDVIAEKQEKVLVFTQFREMTAPLADHLETIFGRRGLVLHGETPVKKRSEMVGDFQRDDGPPYFVLSLRAGGTGLNLTAASHVVHFDRWWNPAVEDQATDRVFRIGQKKNVLVHKFISRGTLEEKIDALIESKQTMSREILEGADNVLLTEMPNEELLRMVSLDIRSAVGEI
ncbi:MAG: DEAD/DEAH box helicase [Candidatus Omnitrophica bacterium]|nr:DEAD/DEAH box helicase [Candidatus Omnitrophota bacterium]